MSRIIIFTRAFHGFRGLPVYDVIQSDDQRSSEIRIIIVSKREKDIYMYTYTPDIAPRLLVTRVS